MTRLTAAAAALAFSATTAGAAALDITDNPLLTDSYTPVATGNHGLELRDGRPGARDWELGLGTNTQQTGMFDQERNFSWDDSSLNTGGGGFQWAFDFIYSGGTSEFRIWDAETGSSNDAYTLSYDGLTTGGNTINITTKRGAAINITEIDGQMVDFTFGELTPLTGYRDSQGYIYSADFNDGFSMSGTLDMFDEGRGSKHGILIRMGNVLGAPANTAPIPLPATLPLIAAGVGGLALLRHRRKRASKD